VNDKWLKDQLVLALAIMDEKGRARMGESEVSLWRRDWERLRATLLECQEYAEANGYVNTIERMKLRARVAELEGALRLFADTENWYVGCSGETGKPPVVWHGPDEPWAIARAALGDE